MVPKPTLAIAMHGIARSPGEPMPARAAFDWAAAAGFRAIQFDAAAPDLRPRTLDRSARRDLAAILRRAALGCSGLDLWIPPEHLTDAARAQRAHDSITQAIDLAADLTALGAECAAISLTMPPSCPRELLVSLGEHSARRGVRIADHAIKHPEDLIGAGIFLGLDPAAVLLAQQDPIATAARAGDRLASARLSDASLTARVAPGSRDGRLDIQAYAAALSVAGCTRAVILDLRGVDDQSGAARAAQGSW